MGHRGGGRGLSPTRRRAVWVLAWLDCLVLFWVAAAAAARDFEVVAVLLPTHVLATALLLTSLCSASSTAGRWHVALAVGALGPFGALRALARTRQPPPD